MYSSNVRKFKKNKIYKAKIWWGGELKSETDVEFLFRKRKKY